MCLKFGFMLDILSLKVLQITCWLVEAKSKLRKPTVAVNKEGNYYLFNFLTVYVS